MNPLETEMCGVKMKNPLIVASGPPTNDAELMKLAFESGAGGVVTKTMTDMEMLRESLIDQSLRFFRRKGILIAFPITQRGDCHIIVRKSL